MGGVRSIPLTLLWLEESVTVTGRQPVGDVGEHFKRFPQILSLYVTDRAVLTICG